MLVFLKMNILFLAFVAFVPLCYAGIVDVNAPSWALLDPCSVTLDNIHQDLYAANQVFFSKK